MIEVGVKSEWPERSGEVIELTDGVVTYGVSFRVVVEVGGVAVCGYIAGNDRNWRVKIVAVFDLTLVAVIAAEAVVTVIAVLVVVAVAVCVGRRVDMVGRSDCMDERQVSVRFNHGPVWKCPAVAVVPGIVVMYGAEKKLVT